MPASVLDGCKAKGLSPGTSPFSQCVSAAMEQQSSGSRRSARQATRRGTLESRIPHGMATTHPWPKNGQSGLLGYDARRIPVSVKVELLAEMLAGTVAFLLVALPLGEATLIAVDRFIRWPEPERVGSGGAVRAGSALLVGFGTLSYVGVVLGVCGIFEPLTLAAVGIATVALGWRSIVRALRRVVTALQLRSTGAPDVAYAVLVVMTLGWFLANFTAALAPPWLGDAIAYHLPQAREIASTHHLPANVGGHFFFGNIPKLVEVLFAEALVFSRAELAQCVDFAILGSFLLFTFGLVRDLFNRWTAILAVLLLLLYEDLLVYATTAYIDAATVSFEAGSVLAIAAWIQWRSRQYVTLAPLLIGFALSAKYSTASTAVFLLVVVGATILASRDDRRRMLAPASRLALVAIAACAYWYGKNLIRFGNPVYPLYFGHPGVDEEGYKRVLSYIQQFGPRTIGAFIRIPTHFLEVTNFVPFLSFFVAPFALFVRTSRRATLLLLCYVVLYIPYWFFLATQQIRFLMPALVIAIILIAVVVTNAALPARALAVAAAAVAAISLHSNALARNVLVVAVDSPQVENIHYAFSSRSRDNYLSAKLGCQYDAITYLDRQPPGKVIDNWSLDLAHVDRPGELTADPNLPRFYAKRHVWSAFVARPANASSKAWSQDFRYLYFSDSAEQRFFAARAERIALERGRPDAVILRYRQTHAAAERSLLTHAHQIWTEGDCHVYQLSR